MKTLKLITVNMLMLFCLLAAARAADDKAPKPKPYTLETCAVCGMKLSMMGKPYVFVYKDREIKVCGKDEEAKFEKEPAKYLKQIEAAEAKAKEKPTAPPVGN